MSELVSTPFGWGSTASEVIAGVNLHGQRAIVTGSASGIGVETARALAGAGAEVTLAVRNLSAGQQTAAMLAADPTVVSAGGQLRVAALDLSDQASVDAFVHDWSGPLHLLVNNAGVMAAPFTRTREGWELQLATNHLGHFALSTGLLGALRAAGGARVVSLSSAAHLNDRVHFEDLHFEDRSYDPALAYAQSKTANVLFAVEAGARWADDGIEVNALHPGAIADTNLARYYDPKVLADLVASGTYEFKSVQQGAATSVLVATSPLLTGVHGRYFEDCNEAAPVVPGERRGVAAHALDPEAAAQLWKVSVAMVGGAPGDRRT